MNLINTSDERACELLAQLSTAPTIYGCTDCYHGYCPKHGTNKRLNIMEGK